MAPHHNLYCMRGPMRDNSYLFILIHTASLCHIYPTMNDSECKTEWYDMWMRIVVCVSEFAWKGSKIEFSGPDWLCLMKRGFTDTARPPNQEIHSGTCWTRGRSAPPGECFKLSDHYNNVRNYGSTETSCNTTTHRDLSQCNRGGNVMVIFRPGSSGAALS